MDIKRASAAGVVWVDRGDPASADYAVGDLTKDAAWHDLDLSGIVGTGARLVALSIVIGAAAIPRIFNVRQNGNVNAINIGSLRLLVANETIIGTIWVKTDADGKIEYYASAGAFTTLDVSVRGWLGS